ncbi:MAG: hypothetical protein JWR68_3104 [Polaromonas sp.]|nr:hypothetical protein [Polaromonas sp.]
MDTGYVWQLFLFFLLQALLENLPPVQGIGYQASEFGLITIALFTATLKS